MTDDIKKIAEELFQDIIRMRRELHMYPEEGYKEFRTSEYIARVLRNAGIETTTGIAGTGVVGIIKGEAGDGKTIMLRADIDANTIREEVQCEYTSKVDGMMHACGHDGHTASLLGTALILSRLKDKLKGNVKLVFQPAEEKLTGARKMIEEGVLDNPKVDACLGMHLWPSIPSGKIIAKAGPVLSAGDFFDIKITGKSGHGSQPHFTVDPISAGSKLLNELYTTVIRKIDPSEAAVISVCSFNAGSYYNIIPDTAELKGTIRSFKKEVQDKIHKNMQFAADKIGDAEGVKIDLAIHKLVDVTENDSVLASLVRNSIKKIAGEDSLEDNVAPSTGCEDFSFYSQKVPGVFLLVGCGFPDKADNSPLHSSTFQMDENCLLLSVQVFVQAVCDYLLS
ncbi:MAG TPA: amidohydrolase [Clostridiaceae bacterium]|nr:amidohydrolase [Clostridiaceae bacterium]